MTLPRINQNIVIRAYPNSSQFLVMDTKNGDVYQTNQVGKRILESCDGNKTIEDIIRELEKVYGKKIGKDVRNHIDELEKAGAITLTG